MITYAEFIQTVMCIVAVVRLVFDIIRTYKKK